MIGTPRRFHTEAVVIRHLNYGEADRILTLYTPERGKLHVIAKGVRRAKSHNAGHLELFNRCSLVVYAGRNLGVLGSAELVENFPQFRQNLEASGFAHYVCELIDLFVPEGLANPSLFETQLKTLRLLGQGSSFLVVRAFELALLDTSGYRPELRHCVGCGRAIQAGDNRLSNRLGGVLCNDCVGQDLDSQRISNTTLKLLRNLQRQPDRVLRLESVDAGVGRETETRLREYITYLLERHPKSVSVLQRVAETLPRSS
jgi:DNA repair protein RecO (recombination protein O)